MQKHTADLMLCLWYSRLYAAKLGGRCVYCLCWTTGCYIRVDIKSETNENSWPLTLTALNRSGSTLIWCVRFYNDAINSVRSFLTRLSHKAVWTRAHKPSVIMSLWVMVCCLFISVFSVRRWNAWGLLSPQLSLCCRFEWMVLQTFETRYTTVWESRASLGRVTELLGQLVSETRVWDLMTSSSEMPARSLWEALYNNNIFCSSL